MARNRKYHSTTNRFGPALKAFLICLLLGGSAVGYVWQKNQIKLLGQKKASKEKELRQLVNQNKRLEQNLQVLQNPKRLEKQLQGLGLVLPPLSQVWTLPEPAPGTPKPATDWQHVSKSEQIAKSP